MEKIFEKLSNLGVLAEDLNEIKNVFESLVEAKVKEKSEIESKDIAAKAQDFIQQKIQEATTEAEEKYNTMAKEYCAEIKAQYEKEANEKVKEYSKALQEAAKQYSDEILQEAFDAKYGEELQKIESKCLKDLDDYLRLNVNKIDPSLLKKVALAEMAMPIIDGVKSLFHESYIDLDTTGTKKIRELKSENAELQKSLKKQLSENLRLAEVAEVNSKKALISEKTEGMTYSQKNKVQKFFEKKSYAETKQDIDKYVDMLDEQAEAIRSFNQERQRLYEKQQASKMRTHFRENRTTDVIKENVKEKNLTKQEELLLKTSRYV